MTNQSKLCTVRLTTARLGIAALCAGAIALPAFADDITPIIGWGASTNGAEDGLDPAFTEAFTAFTLGDYHGMAIVYPGDSVHGWGLNSSGQAAAPALTGGVRYTGISAGSNHTALLRTGGDVVCVGSNTFGQCTVPAHPLPFDSVTCGANFTIARDLNGDLYAWGDNTFGQSTVPVLGGRAEDFSGGLDHAVALLGDGSLIFWGDNSEGEQTPPTLPFGILVSSVKCGWNTTAFLLSNGTVQVSGDNSLLQQVVPALGVGQTYLSLRAHGYTIGARRSDDVPVVWGNTSNDLDIVPATPISSLYADFQLGLNFAGVMFTRDCNIDGTPDLAQIEATPTLDCNGDLRIDSCETGVSTHESSTVSPFSSASTVTVTAGDLPNAVGDVTVEVEVKADLGSPGEYLTLTFNGQVIDYIFLQGGANCPASFQKETIFLPSAMFNSMLDEGSATFVLSASTLVSATECPTSAAKTSFNYLYDSADCNDNGTPDSCELASGLIADINLDGIPDTCQLTPIGDLDGDRMGDVAWFNPASRQFSVWFMSGLTRTAGGLLTETCPTGFDFGGIGDLDGDGRSDIVLRNLTTGAVKAMLLAGTVVVESGTVTGVVPQEYRLLGVFDLDHDGNDDILWKSGTTGKVYGWLMHGLIKLASGEIGPTTGLTYLGAGDLDGDGDADLLWRNTSNVVSGWLLNGLTIQAQGDISGAGPVFGDWAPSGLGDMDGDGKADLLWRNTSTGQLNAWFMNGLTKNSGGTITSAVGLGYNLAALVDLDGDSKSDIVWRNTASGDVNGWLMDGLTKRSGAFIRGASLDWRIINP